VIAATGRHRREAQSVKLARKVGVSRRTLERAMRDAAAAGAVMLETGKNGTRLALAG